MLTALGWGLTLPASRDRSAANAGTSTLGTPTGYETMARRNQVRRTRSARQRRRSTKPTVGEELTQELADLPSLPGGPMAKAGGSTVQARAARLGDPPLQTAQRQDLATQIGRVQGNRHLQRVVASLKQAEETSPVQPHNIPTTEAEEVLLARAVIDLFQSVTLDGPLAGLRDRGIPRRRTHIKSARADPASGNGCPPGIPHR